MAGTPYTRYSLTIKVVPFYREPLFGERVLPFQSIISNLKISEAEAYAQRLLLEATIHSVKREVDKLKKDLPDSIG